MILPYQNQPGPVKVWTGFGSRALGITEDVWHQKYEIKKEGLQNYLEYSLNSILNIFYHSWYRALDPDFGQNRVHITEYNDLTLALYWKQYSSSTELGLDNCAKLV